MADGEAVPSVTGVWPAANWLEREVYDMFGITFAGHPDLRRILMPDDWQGHPAAQGLPARRARRAADGEPAGLAEGAAGGGRGRHRVSHVTMETESPRPMFDTDELVLNMGPQHPSTHGVLRLVLKLDGERVVDCDPVIGYLHRGIEKLCEHRDYTQIVLLTDRMDYVAAATNNLGYVETVEKLYAIEVPRRARYIRTILSELQRVASHLVWLGTHAMDIGALTVLLYGLRERELVLDLFEEYCGARLTYNAMRIGGLPVDVPPGWDKKVAGVLRRPGAEAARVRAPARRTTASSCSARRTSASSRRPTPRPSGCAGRRCGRRACARDVRKDEPYAAYDEMEFDVAAGDAGRHVRPLPGPARGDSRSRCGSSARRSQGCPRARSWARCRG